MFHLSANVRPLAALSWSILLGVPVFGWLLSVIVGFVLVVRIAGDRRAFPAQAAPIAARRSLVVFPLYLGAAVAGTGLAAAGAVVSGLVVMWLGGALSWAQFFLALRRAVPDGLAARQSPDGTATRRPSEGQAVRPESP